MKAYEIVTLPLSTNKCAKSSIAYYHNLVSDPRTSYYDSYSNTYSVYHRA